MLPDNMFLNLNLIDVDLQEKIAMSNDLDGNVAEALKLLLEKAPTPMTVGVKMCIDSNSGASEISCINGRGFNFDVVPSLIGIWCPLISRVGDVGDVGGVWKE